MREIRQVDFETGQCTFEENGSLGAASLWDGGSGSAADMDQSGKIESSGSSPMWRARQMFDHDSRTPPTFQTPIQLYRSLVISSGNGLCSGKAIPRVRPKIGEDWTRIATAMVARSPAVRWWYVREHLLAVIVTLVQHNWVPIRHTSWKDPEGNRWSLNTARVRIDDWGFWQSFRPSIEGQLWEKAARHELGSRLGWRGRAHHVVQS